jgi:hypothetical protein
MNAMIEKSSARVDAAEIRRGFTVVRVNRDNERNYRYAHSKTGRQLTVSRLAQARRRARFFLSELIPSGRMLAINSRGDVIHAWDEPCIEEAVSRVSPNELLAALRAMGIDADALVLWGRGYSSDSIYHESLEACAESISRVLHNDVRYISYIDNRASEKTKGGPNPAKRQRRDYPLR